MSVSPPSNCLLRNLGLQDYEAVWQAMKAFTAGRHQDSPDEVWLVEHRPVFTLGQAGKSEHILNPGHIPIVKTDRGGQVTYHGPGQLVLYLLADIRRRGLGVRKLVDCLEESIIKVLGDYGIEAAARKGAPGVYVQGEKIAALGLRIHRGCSYHGLSFNLDMDLEPFTRINPCGYEGLKTTQLRDLISGRHEALQAEVSQKLLAEIAARMGYNGFIEPDDKQGWQTQKYEQSRSR